MLLFVGAAGAFAASGHPVFGALAQAEGIAGGRRSLKWFALPPTDDRVSRGVPW